MTIAIEETKETPETEVFDGPGNRNDSDEWFSPRGVLEIPILGSDSDNGGSSRGSSCGSSAADKSAAHRAPVGENQGLQWRNFIDDKWKSVKRLSTITLLSGYEISRKNLRRKICRTRVVNHETDDGDSAAAPRPSWRNFSNAEIAAATDNFCSENLIGKGGHAEVYKGSLPDGQVVAVKRITKMEKDGENRVRDFLSELGVVAHINHPNAAKLIGFSAESGLHLVLQYLPQGSLASVLHGSKESLEWNKRLKVARGVAEGLKYLHCECQRRIIHRDITASNILLTDNYEPQISDFGLAKWLPEKCLQHVVHPIEGTFGYMAPEYFMHGIVNEKTDVFAFGVLLLELITGRRAVDSCRQSLVMWAKPLLENNKIKEIVDPRLADAYNIGEMKRAMSTALACLHHLPNMRPGMDRVVQLLRGEGGQIDLREKSLGGRALLFCDVEDYTSTSYLNDLDRHRQLILE